MEYGFDLSKAFGDAATAKGRSWLEHYRLSRRTETWQDNGSVLIKGKAIDSFNFVSRPWLSVSSSGREITGCGCDCAASKQEYPLCEHCAALALSLLENCEAFSPLQDDAALPEQEPASCDTSNIGGTVAPNGQTEPAGSDAPIEPTDTADPHSMEVLFGYRLDDDTPVYWLPNDTEHVFHTNTGIIGTMGTGKTQFTKSLVTQICRNQKDNFDGRGIGILIFDYKGDYNETKEDFCKATNARVLKPYKLPFNPLALNRTRSFRPLLPTHTANEFKDTISKIYNLGPKQQQTLMDSIMRAYANQGIRPEAPETWNNTAPTFEQVYQVFVGENPGRAVDSLTAAMNKLHQFVIFEDNPAKARPLSILLEGVVVVDLSGEESDIQSLVVAITLDQFYAQMQSLGSSATDGRYRQLRNLILVDEADTFMAQGFQSLRKIMKEGREFGVGVILSTQSLSHFVGGDDDYSRYVLTWVVHNVSDLKQRDVEYVFKLQPKSEEIMENYAAIKGLKKHESVVKVSNDMPISIRDKAFWELYHEINGNL